jgi:putative DNA primase/helicase
MKLERVTQHNPCPICGKTKWCSVSDDGAWVICMNEQSDRPTTDGKGWMHRLTPPVAANGHVRVKAPSKGTEIRYEIRSPAGETVAIHCRRDPPGRDKVLWWELPNGTKGLKSAGLTPATLPLYGIDQVAEVNRRSSATADGTRSTVVVVEGEKARDALDSIGVLAVGTVTGATVTPAVPVLEALADCNVCLWPDNDDVGRAHMREIGRRLVALGVPTRVLTWLDAPPKGDAVEFVAAGLGRDVLNGMYAEAEILEVGDVPEEVLRADGEQLHLTDMGNAERLVARHGADLRYCGLWRRWIVWGGETWNDNGDDGVQERAKETVLAIYEEGIAASNPERAQVLWKHAQRSESAGRVHAMIDLARSTARLAVAPDDLDRDPWLLNCANGTIDLRRGVLLPFTREDLMTKRSPAIFDGAARCPTWLAFLDQIFAGDAEMIGFMRRSAGYCLSGSTVERVLFILFGAGRNGKSTFLEVIRHVLGDYASGTPASTILSQRNKGIPNDIARLKGARFVSASETSDGAEIDEAFIKIATGGDTITARFLNAEFFDFRPQFKIWLATNHKPLIKGTDPAVWDRIRLVPFMVRIPEEQLDKALRDKLILEADGILGWMIGGCLEWQRLGGLGEPEKVRAATEEYRLNENMFGAFLAARCHVPTEPSVIRPSALAGALYATYKEWAKQTGEEAMSQRRFGDRLREQGFQAGKNNQDQRVWRGLELLTPEEQAAQDA